MTYTPEHGGQILFVGGPEDARYLWMPPGKGEVVVVEIKDPGFKKERTKYLLQDLPWGLKESVWWIMQHESIKELSLHYLLMCERKALNAVLPPTESCAVPMKPGPLCNGSIPVMKDGVVIGTWTAFAPIPGIHFDGYL